jgi:phosphate acetyltransferase
MRFIGSVIEKLQRHPKRIVFPEGNEPRVLQAARQFFSLRLGAPILLGDRTRIKEAALQLNVSLEGIRVLNPAQSEELPGFVERYRSAAKDPSVTQTEAAAAMVNPNFFGAMMVAMRQADGFVSGAREGREGVLRPLFQIVNAAPLSATISSCLVMEVQDSRFGDHGVMFLADCGVVPEPNADQLADIAVSTAILARQLLGTPPRVALLSYSTKGSAAHASVGACRPRSPWRGRRPRPDAWSPSSTGSYRWTPHSFRRLPSGRQVADRWPAGPMCSSSLI